MTLADFIARWPASAHHEGDVWTSAIVPLAVLALWLAGWALYAATWRMR